jgi:hypothetical protein
MNAQRVTVIFRVDKEKEIFALMPELQEGRYCTSYQHVGQHGAADYHACIAASRPATPAEYAELAHELTRIGYDLTIRRRWVRPRRATP